MWGKQKTSKYVKVRISWMLLEKVEMRCFIVNGGRWKDVEQVGFHMKVLDPESGQYVGLKHKVSDNIVYGEDHTFGFSILLTGVWTGISKLNTIFRRVIMKLMVVVSAHIGYN